MSFQFRRIDSPLSCVRHVRLRQQTDVAEDASYLLTVLDEDNRLVVDSQRYSNDDVQKCGWEKVKQWVEEDLQEYQTHGEEWEHLFLWAEATVSVQGVLQTIQSGGVAGVDDRSQRSWLDSLYREELGALEDILKALGFDVEEFENCVVNECGDTVKTFMEAK